MFLQERHGDQRPQLQTGRRTEPCLTAPEEDQGTPGIHPIAYNHNDDTFHFFFTYVTIRTISFVTIGHHILDDISHFIDAFVLTVIISHLVRW